MIGVYQGWGFRAPPFETRPLPANAEGVELLVGRDTEVLQIVRRLISGNKIVTVEGPNGIGKTSINNVASFTAFDSFLKGESDQLIIPCQKIFQIQKIGELRDFVESVFLQVGLTLVKHADELKQSGRALPEVNSVEKWLTSPTLGTVRGSLSAYGLGAGAGLGTAANIGAGFLKAGFPDLVRGWLAEIFPAGQGGGVVCVIDNLELLRESEAARRALEELRDEILSIEGLRWILCGSTGIVRTIAATPRMQGYLHAPVDIAGVDPNFTDQILNSRLAVYRVNEEYYIPLTATDFSHLYSVLHGNIRDTLSAADDFCNWVCDEGSEFADNEKKHQQFISWLERECLERLRATESIMTDRPWKLFHDIIEAGGQCSPGAFGQFGFETTQGMRAQILKLEAANLVKSVRDEEDNRRKTILLTSSGWMVAYARKHGLGTLYKSDPTDESEARS